jgi:hypothetical protein
VNPREDVRVYLGPTLHKRTLITGNAYRGGLSAYVTGLLEKIPEMNAVIVPMSEVANTRRKIQEPGTEENRVYEYLKTVRFNPDGEVRG